MATKTKSVESTKHIAVRCDQCAASMINGVFCHETGCVNGRKTWLEDRQEWVLFKKCFYCGCDAEVGEYCGCCVETGWVDDEQDEMEDEDDDTDEDDN